jgi:broad specificity phosphatase PhoE
VVQIGSAVLAGPGYDAWMLILVRHAMPDYRAEVPPDRWELGEDGRSAARRLGAVLPSGALLVASAEPKAWQTLESLGPVTRDRRFNEVGRVEPWEGDYLRLRREYVNGADRSGWEPRDQVAARFAAAVSDYLSAADGRPLVVATHGMAMTIWLSAAIGLADPAGFWSDLRFPDAHRVELGAGAMARFVSPMSSSS